LQPVYIYSRLTVRAPARDVLLPTEEIHSEAVMLRQIYAYYEDFHDSRYKTHERDGTRSEKLKLQYTPYNWNYKN